MQTCKVALAACLLLWRVAALAESTTQPVPLVHVHAHNDFAHARPLLDALDHGFCSVEADIHLVGDKLLVAHDVDSVRPDRTLQSLYLEPLRQRAKANGGRIYRGGPTVVLLIDVKTPFTTTYPALKDVLHEYADILTTWQDDQRKDGAVTAIISGERKQQVIAADNPRWCACDGQMSDLASNPSAELVPWISAQWTKTFHWLAKDGGPMPDEERAMLRDIVARAHEQKRRLRWWGAPDNAAFWAELRSAGVDLINTDDLAGAQAFLLQEEARRRR
jgi:hypothetical protein